MHVLYLSARERPSRPLKDVCGPSSYQMLPAMVALESSRRPCRDKMMYMDKTIWFRACILVFLFSLLLNFHIFPSNFQSNPSICYSFRFGPYSFNYYFLFEIIYKIRILFQFHPLLFFIFQILSQFFLLLFVLFEIIFLIDFFFYISILFNFFFFQSSLILIFWIAIFFTLIIFLNWFFFLFHPLILKWMTPR
jgi:hypothetical protein